MDNRGEKVCWDWIQEASDSKKTAGESLTVKNLLEKMIFWKIEHGEWWKTLSEIKLSLWTGSCKSWNKKCCSIHQIFTNYCI